MEVADFDAERSRLTAIATRILGSEADADDVLQETWLRLSRTNDIDDVPAWLTTVVTRLCLDQLRKRRTRSAAEAETPADPAPVDPEADALLAEKMGDAMQVVLDALAPAERAAFVLHDVFGYPFDEISAVMGRSGTAVRQLASRARRKVQGVPEPVASQEARAENHRVVDAFLTAARGGDLSTLLLLLAPDAVMRADLVGQTDGYGSGLRRRSRRSRPTQRRPGGGTGDHRRRARRRLDPGRGGQGGLRVPCRSGSGARGRADCRSRRAGDLGRGPFSEESLRGCCVPTTSACT
jgi:RNA polymerase sigma factor (sigma-70 family)